VNWDSVKYILAVARLGSYEAAAQLLKVNQSTVRRHITSFEHDLDAFLFQKDNSQYILTDLGQTVLVHAEKLELDALALANAVADQDVALAGTVRITAVESLINHFIIPRLVGFSHLYPQIRANFIAESGNLKVERREADIAIRLARPEAGDLRISKLGDVGLAVFGTDIHRRSLSPAQWKTLPWVTYDENLSHVPEMQWLQDTVPNPHVALTSSSAGALASAIQSGAGIGILPCLVGDRTEGLLRLTGPKPLLRREAWLVLHMETHKTPRIRAASTWLTQLFKRHSDVLLGVPLT
jgi:DNA-binding transcriptional LysR family regulator